MTLRYVHLCVVAVLLVASSPACRAAAAQPRPKLVPVVVATRNIAAGETVTYDDLAQRPAPEAIVTSSIVKPDSTKYIAGQRVLLPVLAGDMLLWSDFEMSSDQETYRACAELTHEGSNAEQQVARARQRVLQRDTPQ